MTVKKGEESFPRNVRRSRCPAVTRTHTFELMEYIQTSPQDPQFLFFFLPSLFSGNLAGGGGGLPSQELRLHIRDRAADSAAEGHLTPKHSPFSPHSGV